MYRKLVGDQPVEWEVGGEGVRVLLPRSAAERLEVKEVHFPKGMSESLATAVHSHADEEQAYLIVSGTGVFASDGEETKVEKGTFLYIRRDVKHGMIPVGDEELVYLLVSCFLDS